MRDLQEVPILTAVLQNLELRGIQLSDDDDDEAAGSRTHTYDAPENLTPSASLFASLSIGTRHASILANLSDNKGAYNKRIRVGRGASSGKGKTSGRGHKGQGQHGKVKPWFQGGQTPLVVQRGTKGFENRRAPVMSKINLDKLQQWIDAGRIDPTKRITNHNHAPAPRPAQANGAASANHDSNGQTGFGTTPSTAIAGRTMSSYTTATVNSNIASPQQPTSTGVGASPAGGGWGGGFFDGSNVGGGFAEPQPNPVLPSPFGAAGEPNRHLAAAEATITPSLRPLPSNRTGGAVEENIVVSLMPEKEGLFFFQHHNYEVSSSRRGINGNHLSNDGAFIEKRRRGLARFLNAVVRHPILGQEQLVIMFLTVPTELTVWRKQATISVQDEFVGRTLPPGLEDSLPATLEELFDRSRTGVRRSAELYINVCNIMDRLVKRSDGVAADHARIALSLQSLTELSNDTYATDTNDVPLLNDGLTAMSKHLKTCQSLMEDESKAWDQGVLEDLKRQRDSLVAIREMFERRNRLDKDNIPYLERRIQTNESKLANLRGKPDGLVKPGEIEKVVEAIIKDKESIVNQHNRSIFVKECIRDELIYFQSTQYHVSRWNQDWAQERVKYSEM
ncbi:hypothetical protein BN1723_012283, partial [Verticillium longisporum]